jgi:hypothetical protein
MATPAIKRTRHLLTAGGLVLIACAAFFAPAARFDTQAREEPAAAASQTPTPTPLPTPAWRQPTRPDTKYVCDWKRPGSQGMADVRLEYTRQTPQNGWLGKLHTRYPDGKTRVDLIQLFAPRAVPRLGTEWSFQTTDGKIRCKLTVMRGSGEVRFGNCSNGVEQYCVDQRVLDILNQLPDRPCAECAPQGIFNRVACVTRCLNSMAGRPPEASACLLGADPRRPDELRTPSPVACMIITYLLSLEMPGAPREQWRELITYYGLAELRQSWIDFVNGQMGGCTSSHLCPGGTMCVSGKCQDWTRLVK